MTIDILKLKEAFRKGLVSTLEIDKQPRELEESPAVFSRSFEFVDNGTHKDEYQTAILKRQGAQAARVINQVKGKIASEKYFDRMPLKFGMWAKENLEHEPRKVPADDSDDRVIFEVMGVYVAISSRISIWAFVLET